VGGDGTDSYSYAPRDQSAPYWDIARKYALADHFFSSHNSESYTAHQYLFSGQTGAIGTVDDPQPRLPASPAYPGATSWNCSLATQLDQKTFQWDPNVATLTAQEPAVAAGPGPCWQYSSLADLLNAKRLSWRLYIPFTLFDVNSLASMQSIYGNPQYWPANCTGLVCVNNDYFRANLSQFLVDEAGTADNAKYKSLADVTWLLAPLYDSDHPLGIHAPRSQGPSWVASVVDAIGNSPDWASTAIFITWDDWGGYYDHVPPYVVRDAAGVGFRVPLMIVSPYTVPGCILKTNSEFGTLLKFTEDTFNLASLGANAVDGSPFINDLNGCFDWSAPRPFRSVIGAQSTAFWKAHFGASLPASKDQIRDE
jgi:phospholipase C